ncbi:MAG: sporulation protein [Clostridia bacterium]|nr:sporulation protein [Clostridia bacterium]
MREKRKISFSEAVKMTAELMDLPEDVLLGLPRLDIGGGEVLMERHRGIIDYSEECIKVAAKRQTVKISGSGLELVAMNKTQLRIRGEIAAVEFIR